MHQKKPSSSHVSSSKQPNSVMNDHTDSSIPAAQSNIESDASPQPIGSSATSVSKSSKTSKNKQLSKSNQQPSKQKNSLPKRLLDKTVDKTLYHARGAINFASDTTDDVMEFVGYATDATLLAFDQVTDRTRRGMSDLGQFSANKVRGVVAETSEVAKDVALHMARSFLGNAPLTLYLPEVLLNNQIRKRINPEDIDHITVQCGNNRFQVEIDGHYRQLLYRLTLDFDVLECRIGQAKYLRLRQNDEKLDLQVRHANTMTNWATRRVGHIGFEIANRLPLVKLINHLIRDIPGIEQEKHRYWYIDLEKAGFIDFINNPSWMIEKLVSLTDFSILPGLNILRESREVLRQLVEQFEICGLTVQSGRLEVQVKISSPT